KEGPSLLLPDPPFTRKHFTHTYLISQNDRAVLATSVSPIYQGPSEKRRIALTFNIYWGEEYLPKMLQILRENKAGATFFLGGQWVEKHAQLARDIARDFEIGSHGYAHRHPDQLSVEENLAEIARAEKVIQRTVQRRLRLFAPPFGECGPQVLEAANRAGYQVILWSIDPVDWRETPASVISERVITKAHNGAIVLLHPTSSTVEALPAIIKDLAGRGFEFVTVSKLLAGV
ncbi:MAG: polysaccharide deacetylase family protein, partial [Firmicutes bacterium]|nr:polysaccharide deacetylase family protein [Bacillota bacterium]